jgi:hypothetical protein
MPQGAKPGLHFIESPKSEISPKTKAETILRFKENIPNLRLRF